jgi:hypothetical protein
MLHYKVYLRMVSHHTPLTLCHRRLQSERCAPCALACSYLRSVAVCSGQCDTFEDLSKGIAPDHIKVLMVDAHYKCQRIVVRSQRIWAVGHTKGLAVGRTTTLGWARQETDLEFIVTIGG